MPAPTSPTSRSPTPPDGVVKFSPMDMTIVSHFLLLCAWPGQRPAKDPMDLLSTPTDRRGTREGFLPAQTLSLLQGCTSCLTAPSLLSFQA